jgi:anti-anti-sigma factor
MKLSSTAADSGRGRDTATAEAGGFAVESRSLGTRVVLALAGELDHDSAPLLSDFLSTALGRPEVSAVVVDCAGLSFCDSTGLNTLLAARLQAQETGTRLRLAALPRVAERVFEITGATAVFDLYPDVDQALAAE